MKLRDLLGTISQVAKDNHISTPFLCGGVARDRVLGLINDKTFEDIDLTTGNKQVSNLATEVGIVLRKHFNLEQKEMDDGHTSLYTKGLKIDFSSNFISPGIDQELAKKGIKNPTDLQKEMFSRDFTANTLLLSLDLKKIIDPTKEGLKDIKAKILKTCLSPEITLSQNKNRLIRVLYLSAKLGFSVDPSIIDYIKSNKQQFQELDPKYLSKYLNKAISYNKDIVVKLIDEMGLWGVLPITEGLYKDYASRFIKKSSDNKIPDKLTIKNLLLKSLLAIQDNQDPTQYIEILEDILEQNNELDTVEKLREASNIREYGAKRLTSGKLTRSLLKLYFNYEYNNKISERIDHMVITPGPSGATLLSGVSEFSNPGKIFYSYPKGISDLFKRLFRNTDGTPSLNYFPTSQELFDILQGKKVVVPNGRIADSDEDFANYYNIVKPAQLRRNFDYNGESLYFGKMDRFKSVQDFRKKRKKKQKKDIKKIKDMKLAYYNGETEFELNSDKDNFPILVNDDLATKQDRTENKNRKGEFLENEDEKEEDLDKEKNSKDQLPEPAEFAPGLYGQSHGTEGLNAFPMEYYSGSMADEPGAITNNPYNTIYQKANLNTRYLMGLANDFKNLTRNKNA